MGILSWILIVLGIIFAAPVVVYLCTKFGVVGFYRGKEVFTKQNELIKQFRNNKKK